MNRRSKTALVALLAVFAFSAIASASALAAPQWQAGGFAFTGTEQVSIANSTPIKFTGKLGTSTFTIECVTAGSFSSEGAEIFGNNKGSGETFALKGCLWVEPRGCALAGTLDTSKFALSLEDTGKTAPMFSEAEPAGGLLLKWIQRGCLLEEEFRIEGTPRCEWVKPTEQAVTKSCQFTETSGSTLKFSGHPMTITGTVGVELTGTRKGQKWGATP